jgi:hypothetical protein
VAALEVLRAELGDPVAPPVSPAIEVLRAELVGAPAATVGALEVFRAELVGGAAVLLAPLPAITADGLDEVPLDAVLMPGSPEPDGYVSWQQSGLPVTFVGVWPDVHVVAPASPTGATVVVGVRAMLDGNPSPDRMTTITVRPHLEWTASPSGWVATRSRALSEA